MKAQAIASLFLCLAACHSAECSVVRREEVTLGRLADNSDCVLVGVVTSTGPSLVLQTQRVLKGHAPRAVTLESSPYLRWRSGQRAVFFLRRSGGSRFRPLVTEYQRVLITSAAGERELLAAVASRFPRLEGKPDRLQASLFSQLNSGESRIREDAAWDLLGQRSCTPGPTQLRELSSALRRFPSAPIVRLCARWASPDNLEPLLRLALGSEADLGLEAAATLERVNPGLTLRRLHAKFRGSTSEARAALRLASALSDGEARGLLLQGIRHPEGEVRLEAVKAFARGGPRTEEIGPLKSLLWAPEAREVHLSAAAILALAGEGAAIREVAERHPDPEVQRFAVELRGDPVRVARQLLLRP